jgi:hypothetical protein
MDFVRILYGGDGIVGDVDHSNIAGVYTSEVVQLLNRLVDLDEFLFRDDYFEGDLNSMLSNPVASIISKCRTFKLLRRGHLLKRLVDLDEILYCGNGIKGDPNHSKMVVCLSVHH